MFGMSGIKVNKGRDVFPAAVIVNRIGIVGRIQKELFYIKLWKVCFHSKKGMEKGKHIMPGSPFQKGKYREVTMGIGCHNM